jgi:prostaglandin-endoperoxide synthase 2
MSDSSEAMAVPGRYGPPIFRTVFDTLDFFLMSGWSKFFQRRRDRYGSTVFKVNLLFTRCVALLDQRAIESLFASDDLIQDYGFGWAVPALPLVGNVPPSIFETGERHDRWKSLYAEMLKLRSSSLLRTFQEVAAEFTQKWTQAGKFSFRDELEDLSVTFIFRWILGAAPDPEDVRLLYNNIFSHPFFVFTKDLPGSRYSRSLVIYQKLLDIVKASPGFKDVLGLAHREGLVDDTVAAKQILFLLGMNSFLGVQNFLKSIIGELSLNSTLRDKLRDEIARTIGDVPGKVEFSHLHPGQMAVLDRTLREVLRLHPPVFMIFGRARRDLNLESSTGVFAIGRGELLMGVIPFAQRDERFFPDPGQFDPDRFIDPEASNHLIWPRGLHDGVATAHDRTCPGKDVAVLIGKLFCIALLPGFQWELEEARPRWSLRKFSLNVAAPIGALNVARFERIGPSYR